MKLKKTRFIIPRSQKNKSEITVEDMAESNDIPVENLLLEVLAKILEEGKVSIQHEPA